MVKRVTVVVMKYYFPLSPSNLLSTLSRSILYLGDSGSRNGPVGGSGVFTQSVSPFRDPG